METPRTQPRWSATSPSFIVAAAIAAFLLFLGIRGLLAPEAAGIGFGFPVVDPSDAIWLRVKGDRDVTSALVMGAFLALRWRRALGAMLLASVGSPLLDCILSLSTPGHNAPYALSVHGGTALLVAVLGVVLLRGQGSTLELQSDIATVSSP